MNRKGVAFTVGVGIAGSAAAFMVAAKRWEQASKTTSERRRKHLRVGRQLIRIIQAAGYTAETIRSAREPFITTIRVTSDSDPGFRQQGLSYRTDQVLDSWWTTSSRLIFGIIKNRPNEPDTGEPKPLFADYEVGPRD